MTANPGHNGTPTDAAAPDRLRGRARLALARRDLLEFVRDRRTLFVTLLLPMAMYPILALSSALGVRTAISDIDAGQAPTDLRIMLSGDPLDAQAFATRLESLRPDAVTTRRDWPATLLFAYAPETDAAAAVESGGADLWIDVPDDAVARLDGTGTLALEARGPSARPLAPRVREQFNAVMLDVAADARRRRVDAAGLPESLLSPVKLQFTGKADQPGTVAASTILPTAAGGVFVLLSVLTMTGAFYPAIDAIAGEKERGTIETLLIAPCAAIDIVCGKFLAVWAVALATLVANVISIALTASVSLRFLPKGGPLLPDGTLPLVVVISLVAFIGLSAVAAAMCLAVTTASKSGKEAEHAHAGAAHRQRAGGGRTAGRSGQEPAPAGRAVRGTGGDRPRHAPARRPAGAHQGHPRRLERRGQPRHAAGAAAGGLARLVGGRRLAAPSRHRGTAHRRGDPLPRARRRDRRVDASGASTSADGRPGRHGVGDRPRGPLVLPGDRSR